MSLTLGKGVHGKVVQYDKKYACKILKRSPDAYKEIHITEKVQGIKGVVQLQEVKEDQHHLYMIMEKYEPVMKIQELKPYLQSVLCTIKDIHKANIIHNDIKPQNIMQDKYGNYVIIDFGNSLYSNIPIPPMTVTTPEYCAVESLSSKNCFKSDVWSVGVIAYHELTDSFPFNGADVYEIFRKILNQSIDFGVIEDNLARDFCIKTMERNVDFRLTADQALHHPFLYLQK